MPLHPIVDAVTNRIIDRSKQRRKAYLDFISDTGRLGSSRPRMGCGNLAHGFAAAGVDKSKIRHGHTMNIGIVTAYNDMLSAHQPYGRYPDQIKVFAREVGATAQVAGGVPAMCDGITQGRDGMELSLWSRDIIALATSIALSHEMFEGMALLGICDKIVPGLLIGALRFGHLPAVFIPSGPMPSGLPNKEKQRVRQLYAEGKIERNDLLDAEAASYHDAGTCTFYGTANSNQMMMEVMGLHMPGAAFVNPGTALRQDLTQAAIHRLTEIGSYGDDYRPLGLCIDEKAIVNAAVGLLATGGSTNHAIHLPAIARAAGITIDWEDFDKLSSVIPLITRIYPNGSADVNKFHQAGGMGFVISTLLDAGMLHSDIMTVAGPDLQLYRSKPDRIQDKLQWSPTSKVSGDETILRSASDPFQPDGGMRLVTGNLGRAIFKTSAVAKEHWTIEAPARIFSNQTEVMDAFSKGELNRDVVVVVRFQGPRANGMPELHKLTPPLGSLQDRGFRVALVTDGRMSGASGKVPAAIHVSPEAHGGGALTKLRDGDIIRLCATNGELSVLIDPIEWKNRPSVAITTDDFGNGRELFALMRQNVDDAEKGASPFLAAAGL